MDGDGVFGISNASPMRGAMVDTVLDRKSGRHRKMVNEHKHKADNVKKHNS